MKFSLKLSLFGICIAALMIKASIWQYSKYVEKTALINGYSLNSSEIPMGFPTKFTPNNQGLPTELEQVLYRKVSVKGKYDFSSQVLISNKKDVSGPGFWLLTPFRISNSDITVMVSRGFIPFADREEEKWGKYNRDIEEDLIGIVKEGVKQKFSFVPAKSPALGNKVFLYPDLYQISNIYDFDLLKTVFIQRIQREGDPIFPKESISLRVPPSTHYGYTFEWAFLALFTLAITVAFQVFPGLRTRFSRKMSSSKNLFSSKPQVTQDK